MIESPVATKRNCVTMTIKLYDLAAENPGIRFSPYCWRIRMALAHKGLAVDTVPWRFTDKQAIAFSRQEKVPVIVDGERVVADSWAIAGYLDEVYPDRPLLFAEPQARAHAAFIRNWTELVVQAGMMKQVVLDLFSLIAEKDRAYFRETREKRFGMSLEAFHADAADALPALRKALQPLRATLGEQPFLGGEAPSFADYIAFGAFQWARVASPRDILESGDPIAGWRQKLLDMHNGLAGAMPGRAA